MMGKIELNGMRFRAYHGCLDKEKLDGNDFLVDFSCEYDTSAAEKSDALEDTLDYSAIYGIVRENMEIQSNLLENVAGRIADAIKSEYPGIPSLEVKVTKMNPPVDGPAESSSVTVRR